MGKSLSQLHAAERARLAAVQAAELRRIDGVRGRYRRALAQGMSAADAADYAHDRETKSKKGATNE